MVAFRTVPEDSKGVAHILEHTVLCGSDKFPLKSPFMDMVDRSLKTFMNAFTSADWTAYPYATKNPKDFNNLLSVYLDAVFFPKLDPLAFAQEGHRLEFKVPDDPKSGLQFKGVVFNEMKGALSSEKLILNGEINKVLFPTVTYHHNSGGEPDEILNLSYDQFKAFHQRHYHPSNAIFITYGDIPVEEHQSHFESLALKHFERSEQKITVSNETRFTNPRYHEALYPIAPNTPVENKTFVTVTWLLGEVTNTHEAISTALVCELIYGNSAAPLRRALESSGLGGGIAPVSGLDQRMKEMSFTCGVFGCNAEDADKVEELILSTLTNIADKGVPYEQIEAILHKFELYQREIQSGNLPYGLQLMLRILGCATHYGDVSAVLDIESELEALSHKIKDHDFIPVLVRKLFLDNSHRVRLMMKPCTLLAAQKIEKEQEKLVQIEQQLTEKDIHNIVGNFKNLQLRQSQDQDVTILPKVEVKDVEQTIKESKPSVSLDKPVKLTAYEAGTNGLTYQHVYFTAPSFSNEELKLLPLYKALVTSLGVKEDDYIKTELVKSKILGKYSMDFSFKVDKSAANKIHGNIIFSASGLTRNQEETHHYMLSAIDGVRFDEAERIKEILSSLTMQAEMGVAPGGHMAAMTAAASGLSKKAYLDHIFNSVEVARHFKQVLHKVEDKKALGLLQQQLQKIHEKIKGQPQQHLLVGDLKSIQALTKLIEDKSDSTNELTSTNFDFSPEKSIKKTVYVTNTQVSFCAKAFPSVNTSHPDAATLMVLGNLLSSQYLMKVIREKGGAYGAGAMQDNQSGTFKFFSFRDPRILPTFKDFDASIDWVQNTKITNDMLDQAKLSVISNIDMPFSPSEEAKLAFEQSLSGLDLKLREAFRKQVLMCNVADLVLVAAKYLKLELAHCSVITNSQCAKTLNYHTFEI
jgi:Zn-dependent M16 (insulinase) family peptidase